MTSRVGVMKNQDARSELVYELRCLSKKIGKCGCTRFNKLLFTKVVSLLPPFSAILMSN